MERDENFVNYSISQSYMAMLMELTPNQRLEIIKVMVDNAYQLQISPQMSLQQMLTAFALHSLPPSLTPVHNPIFPFPPQRPANMKMQPLFEPSGGMLPPRAIDVPQQNIFRFPYMEQMRSPRPYHPSPHQYQPYPSYPRGNNYNYNWRVPMAYHPNTSDTGLSGGGPIRNRRRRQVLVRHEYGDLSFFTYEDDCDNNNNSSMQ